jgi:hypothetical protein
MEKDVQSGSLALNLDMAAVHDLVTFPRASDSLQSGKNELNPKHPYVETLNSLIPSNKQNLERKLLSIAPSGCIEASKWAMAQSLALLKVLRFSFTPSLAP